MSKRLFPVVIIAALLSIAPRVAAQTNLLAWGFNGDSQIGDNTTIQRNLPVLVHGQANIGFLKSATTVACGIGHSLAIRPDGRVFAWGRNLSGQIGNGTLSPAIATPVPVRTGPFTFLRQAIGIAGGYEHSVALDANGRVWTVGDNTFGQLGIGTFSAGFSFARRVHDPVTSGAFLDDIKAVASGDYHTMALASDGTVWTWGFNIFGQLGDGTTVNRSLPVKVLDPSTLKPLNNVIAIEAGQEHSLALLSNGLVIAWGRNFEGQLGQGTFAGFNPLPSIVFDLSGRAFGRVKAIAAGRFTSMVLKTDGSVWMWGNNFFGQLGDGTQIFRANPVQVVGINGNGFLDGVKAIAAGSNHSIALRANGQVVAWGENVFGQLGNPFFPVLSTVPRFVRNSANTANLLNAVGVAAGAAHNLIISDP